MGYVGRINPEEYAARKVEGYANDDIIGKDGVEKLFESELRGTPELERVQVNNRGLAIGSQVIRKAQPGHDVQLTLDIDAERMAEQSLQQGIDGARGTASPRRGAVVVLDARSGAVVALGVESHVRSEPTRQRHCARRVVRQERGAPALRSSAQRLRARLHVQDDHRGRGALGNHSRAQRH